MVNDSTMPLQCTKRFLSKSQAPCEACQEPPLDGSPPFCQGSALLAFHIRAVPSEAAVMICDLSAENSADTTPLPQPCYAQDMELYSSHDSAKAG